MELPARRRRAGHDNRSERHRKRPPSRGDAGRDWIAEDPGSHASTFSGGPVISAAADATVSTIVEDSVPGNAAVIGDYLLTELEAAIGDDVRDIRGEGLMIGVEVGRGANAARKACIEPSGARAAGRPHGYPPAPAPDQ